MWTLFLSFSSVQWSELVTKLLQGSDLWLCRWALWRCLFGGTVSNCDCPWLRLELPAPTDDIRYLCAHIFDILLRKDLKARLWCLICLICLHLRLKSIGKIFQVPKRWAKATLEAAQCSSWICGARESLERPSNSNIFQMHGTRLPLLKLFLSYSYDNYNYALQLW